MIDHVIAFILVFVLYLILDIFFAKYTMYVADRKPWEASFFAGMIPLASGVAIIQYVQQPFLLVAAVLGAFVGTFIGVKRGT